jgi:predicted nucleic acid-binding Zn ribbon protein
MTYEYKCSENPEHKNVVHRSITAEEPEEQICIVEGCTGKLSRVFHAPKINLKGGGFSSNKDWV